MQKQIDYEWTIHIQTVVSSQFCDSHLAFWFGCCLCSDCIHCCRLMADHIEWTLLAWCEINDIINHTINIRLFLQLHLALPMRRSRRKKQSQFEMIFDYVTRNAERKYGLKTKNKRLLHLISKLYEIIGKLFHIFNSIYCSLFYWLPRSRNEFLSKIFGRVRK